jgi:phosphoribosyl 1,2-cyclic phosphodiesterase
MTILGSGSAGNATLVRGGGRALLLDGGLSARQLDRRLAACGQDPEGIDALILSHEHGDHVRGASVFSRRRRVPVYGSPASREAAGRSLEDLWAFEPLEAGEELDLGGLRVRPFPVPHDAVSTYGFVVEGAGLRAGYATDLGHVNRLAVERLRGAHLLVLEMNHDPGMLREGPYPWPVKQRVLSRHGHLSNEAAAAVLPELVGEETRAVFLAHLSETNNDPGLVRATASRALAGGGASGPRPMIGLHVARQDAPSATAGV